jgi:hypothetical protein
MALGIHALNISYVIALLRSNHGTVGGAGADYTAAQ